MRRDGHHRAGHVHGRIGLHAIRLIGIRAAAAAPARNKQTHRVNNRGARIIVHRRGRIVIGDAQVDAAIRRGRNGIQAGEIAREREGRGAAVAGIIRAVDRNLADLRSAEFPARIIRRHVNARPCRHRRVALELIAGLQIQIRADVVI